MDAEQIKLTQRNIKRAEMFADGLALAEMVLKYSKEFDTPVPDLRLRHDLKRAMFDAARALKEKAGQ